MGVAPHIAVWHAKVPDFSLGQAGNPEAQQGHNEHRRQDLNNG
jgi:hypothetical protein